MPLTITTPFVSSPFSPDSISDMHLWFDFSDTSTLYQDVSRTTPITADGQSISGVTDKSGNGRHVTAFTTTYKENIKNGLSVMRGPKLLSSGWVPISQPFTIVIASESPELHPTNPGSNKPAVFGINNSSVPRVQFIQWFNGPVYFRSDNPLDTQFGNSFWNVYTFIVNSPNTEVYGGSSLAVQGDSGGNSLPNFQLNSSFDPNDDNSGDIGEVIIYNKALSTSERTAIIDHLLDKWIT